MIFNSANIVLYCVILGVLVLAAILIYIYYRINKNKESASSKQDNDIEYTKKPISFPQKDNTQKIIKAEGKIKEQQQENKQTEEEKPKEQKKADVNTEEIKEEKTEQIKQEKATEQSDSEEESGVLYTAANGEKIQIAEEEGGFVFNLISKEDVMLGKSAVYQTKAGLQKSIKSFANYKETKVFDITITTNDFKIAKFEIFADDSNTYSYNLKTKNSKIKFSGTGFKNKSQCLSAIESVKAMCDNFDIKE